MADDDKSENIPLKIRSKSFSLFGFSSSHPKDRYRVGSLHSLPALGCSDENVGEEAAVVSLEVLAMLWSRSETRDGEYMILITLGREVELRDAENLFSGFICSDVDDDADDVVYAIISSSECGGSIYEPLVCREKMEKRIKCDFCSFVYARVSFRSLKFFFRLSLSLLISKK